MAFCNTRQYSVLITILFCFFLLSSMAAQAAAQASEMEIQAVQAHWLAVEEAYRRGDTQTVWALLEEFPPGADQAAVDRFARFYEAQLRSGEPTLILPQRTAAILTPSAPRVSLNGGICAYETVAAAIAAAASGDAVYIAPGTYNETLGTLNKDLTLTAATADCSAEELNAGPGNVVVDGNGAFAATGGIANIAANTTVIFRNMTLTDASAAFGGILYLSFSSSEVILDGTILSFGDASSNGGAVRSWGRLEMLEGSEIIQNDAVGTAFGGGIAVSPGGRVIMRGDSRIGDAGNPNTSPTNGGGIYLDGGRLEMYDTARIRNNTTSSSGGGIYATNGATVELYDNANVGWVFTSGGNNAANGGGIYLTGPNTSLLLNSGGIIQNNVAVNNGGGILVTGGAGLNGRGAAVQNNRATNGRGGGIYVSGGPAALALSKINANTAGLDGGGIAVVGGGSLNVNVPDLLLPPAAGCDPLSLPANSYCTEFRSNQAGTIGAGQGGAVVVDGGSSLDIRGAAFIGNSGDDGGALASLSGGNDLSIMNGLFTGNSGPAVIAIADAATLALDSSTLASNAGATGLSVASPLAAITTVNTIVWGNAGGITSSASLGGSCNISQDGSLPGSSLDPQFITTARGDYRPGPGSPALDVCSSGPAQDLDHFARPRDADQTPSSQEYDIGAFEGSCTAGPAASVAVSAELSAGDLTLTWELNAGNEGYEVHRNAVPFFTPSPATLVDTLPGSATSWNDAGAAGDWIYLVVAVNCSGETTGASNQTAVFTFTITPGTP